MGKYCYSKGRRKVIKEFTNRQGLWILAVLSAFAMGTLLLIYARLLASRRRLIA